MKVSKFLHKLIEIVNERPDALDSEICVDTEARTYDAHLIKVRNVTHDDPKEVGLDVVVISL